MCIKKTTKEGAKRQKTATLSPLNTGSVIEDVEARNKERIKEEEKERKAYKEENDERKQRDRH